MYPETLCVRECVGFFFHVVSKTGPLRIRTYLKKKKKKKRNGKRLSDFVKKCARNAHSWAETVLSCTTLRGSGRVTESSTVVLIPPTWGKPNYGRCDVFDERPDGRKVARRTGHCLWVGEATAVHRCSHVLARCSTSPPSNWQMALDVR